MLTDRDKAALLELARSSIAERVLYGVGGDRSRAIGANDGLSRVPIASPEVGGVFVTIKRAGALRGCLGTLDIRTDLAAEVARCAADSASKDTRFTAVSPEELGELRLEVSVLGPLEPIEPVPDAFTIGVHGLLVEQRTRRGLLLPQVATEWEMSAEQFLSETCRKAGLPYDAWRRGATVYRFAAEVFGD